MCVSAGAVRGGWHSLGPSDRRPALSDSPYPKAVARFPRVRQSLLSAFDDCALQAKFDLDYRRGYASHPMGRGTLFHRFAARALQEMALHQQSRIDPDTAVAILQDVLRQHDVDDVCHEPHCDRPARVLPEAERDPDGRELICDAGHRHYSEVVNVSARHRADLQWIVRKWANDNEFDVSHLVDVERRLQAVVRYPNPVGGSVERLLTGQLDAVFVDPHDARHVYVLDWKDTWKLPPPTEISFEGYFQQRFYAFLVLSSLRTVERVTLREFYVRYSEPREATLTRQDMVAIEPDIAALVERFDQAVERDVWRPTAGKHCSYCPRPAACPIPVAVRGEGRIVSEEQAARIGAQVLVAEAVLDQARKALQAYVERNGPVPVKDSKGRTVWAYKKTSTQIKPTADQVRAALAVGEDPATLFRERSGTRFGKYNVPPGQEQVEDDALTAALKASLDA